MKDNRVIRAVLVRHGQTDWNMEGRWQGQADPPLNAVGRAQVLRTAWDLRDYHFSRIISSDLKRAMETAAILSRGHPGAVVTDRRLREIHLGMWQGMLSRDIEDQYPDAFRLWHTTPLATRPPGGEHITELAARVSEALHDIMAQHTIGCLAIVAHEFPLAVIACQAAGLCLSHVREKILLPGGWQEVVIGQ